MYSGNSIHSLPKTDLFECNWALIDCDIFEIPFLPRPVRITPDGFTRMIDVQELEFRSFSEDFVKHESFGLIV